MCLSNHEENGKLVKEYVPLIVQTVVLTIFNLQLSFAWAVSGLGKGDVADYVTEQDYVIEH